MMISFCEIEHLQVINLFPLCLEMSISPLFLKFILVFNFIQVGLIYNVRDIFIEYRILILVIFLPHSDRISLYSSPLILLFIQCMFRCLCFFVSLWLRSRFFLVLVLVLHSSSKMGLN